MLLCLRIDLRSRGLLRMQGPEHLPFRDVLSRNAPDLPDQNAECCRRPREQQQQHCGEARGSREGPRTVESLADTKAGNLQPRSMRPPDGSRPGSGRLGDQEHFEENLVSSFVCFDILRNHGILTYSLPASNESPPALAKARSQSSLPWRKSGTETLWSNLSSHSENSESSHWSGHLPDSGVKILPTLPGRIASFWSDGFSGQASSTRKLLGGALEFADELTEQTNKLRSDMEALAKRDKLRACYHCYEEIEEGALMIGDKIGEGPLGLVFEGKWNVPALPSETSLVSTRVDVSVKTFRQYDGAGTLIPYNGGYDPSSHFASELSLELSALDAIGSHPNIVKFLGALTKSRKPRVIFELVKGPSLETFLHGEIMPGFTANVIQNKMAIESIAGWTRDLLSGIEFMHRRDDRKPCIIHGNLKPANLVLVPDLSQLKILDFGVGKVVHNVGVESNAAEPEDSESSPPMQSVDAAESRYMAPELFEPGVLEGFMEKTDVYSASLIIWQIATGRRPFEYDSVGAIMNASEKVRKKMPYVEAMTQWPELGKLCDAAWAASPKDRPSAKELLRMLSTTPRCPPPSTPASPLLYVHRVPDDSRLQTLKPFNASRFCHPQMTKCLKVSKVSCVKGCLVM